MEEFKNIQEIIEKHNTFLITSHVNPDGDSLGCELALSRFLQKLGKKVTILNHNETPKFYEFLDPKKELIKFEEENHKDFILSTEVIIIVDTNQPNRLRSLEPFVIQSKAIKIVIDHHMEADGFANYYLIDEEATSTAEILYNLFIFIDERSIDYGIAQPLYTGIMTDTGSFRFPRTDPETHETIAKLINYGVDPTAVYSSVYECWTLGRIRLLGEMLDSIKLAHNGKLAYAVITRNMFEETGTTEVETDNFVNYTMSIDGVFIGILINEVPNGVKISFRSRGDIGANELAKEFGGGGHKNAAGARLFDVKLEKIINDVINKSEKYIK